MPLLMPWPGPVGEMKVPHFTLDEQCGMHLHHGKSLHASSIIDLGDVHGVWGRYVGSVLRTRTAQMPVLMPWIGPVDEVKVPHFTLDEHCVMHMHHGKSLHASSIIDLGDVHGVWGR